MDATASTPARTGRPLPGRAEQRATRIVFFIAGFGMAAWAPLVPFAKANTGLDEGALGLLLLCFGAGSLVTMPLSGAIAARFGCRLALIVASAVICVSLPLLPVLTSPVLLAAMLFVFGAGVGSVDCVMNIQAVIVERASGRTMMSGFHGLFSVGGILGAGGVSLLLMLGASPLAAALVVAGLIVLAIMAAGPALLPYGGEGDGPAFAVPRGIVLFIGILCFILFLAEGSVLDWSSVFLSAERGLDPAHAGFGYSAFALTMTIGRLTGDRIVRRLGPRVIMLGGGILAAAGFAVATLIAHPLAGFLGFALVGAGCSNIVPVLYSAVGRQKTMPEHIAVPAISTLGYLGILAGPAAIGFVAHAASLPAAFLLLSVLLLGVAFSSRWVGGR